MRCLALRPLAALGWLLARLPQRALLALAALLAWLGHAALAGRRRIARRNLELAFPELDAPAREQARATCARP